MIHDFLQFSFRFSLCVEYGEILIFKNVPENSGEHFNNENLS